MQATYVLIADPTRRAILDLLAQRERTVGELAERFTLTQPSISRHLAALRKGGLVAVRPRGQERVYSLTPEPLHVVRDWVDRLLAE